MGDGTVDLTISWYVVDDSTPDIVLQIGEFILLSDQWPSFAKSVAQHQVTTVDRWLAAFRAPAAH